LLPGKSGHIRNIAGIYIILRTLRLRQRQYAGNELGVHAEQKSKWNSCFWTWFWWLWLLPENARAPQKLSLWPEEQEILPQRWPAFGGAVRIGVDIIK
jgi:hypothetical protein